MQIAPVLRWPGSKWNLAQWIIENMPPHVHYLEPFFGSGAVFFNKRPSKFETINDLDQNVVNLFRVIRDQAEDLAWLISMTLWSRDEYNGSFEQTGDELEDARRFLVRCQQAFGANTDRFTGWRSEVKGLSGGGRTTTWKKLPERIMAITDRLLDAQIENQPAVELVPRFKHKNVLIYADPPYILGTRTEARYQHEMTDADHLELLSVLDAHPGPVLLSGYAFPLYDDRLKHWQRLTHAAVAERGKHREEVLWLNPVAANGQQRLF